MSFDSLSVMSVDHGAGGGASYATKIPMSVDVVVLNNSLEHHPLPVLYKVSLDTIIDVATTVEVTSRLHSHNSPFVMLGEVNGINKEEKKIYLEGGDIVTYSHLIEVAGLRSSCFDDEWHEFVPGVEVLYDALKLRRTLTSYFAGEKKVFSRSLVDKDIQVCKTCLRIAIEKKLNDHSVTVRNDIYVTKNKTFQIEV
jgi:NADH dehydrogenase FAD-containing subunit